MTPTRAPHVCIDALRWHRINDMNQKSHDSMLLYNRLHIHFFFCWNIDVTTTRSSVSAVMLTAADIVELSPLARLFIYALRWGPGSPGWRYSFIGFARWLKEWGQAVEIFFARLVAGLHLRQRLSIEKINWRKTAEVTEWSFCTWERIGDGVWSEIYVADHQR